MLNYWNDFDDTLAMFDDFRRRMDVLLGGGQPNRGYVNDTRPPISLRDDGKTLTLVAEVPGIPQENLKVSLHDDTLTISGERASTLPEGYTLHRRERPQMQFSRSFTLGVKIDPEKTQAELKNGILTLTLERAAEAQPRLIAVKAA
jgi:HSP20 family protein